MIVSNDITKRDDLDVVCGGVYNPQFILGMITQSLNINVCGTNGGWLWCLVFHQHVLRCFVFSFGRNTKRVQTQSTTATNQTLLGHLCGSMALLHLVLLDERMC